MAPIGGANPGTTLGRVSSAGSDDSADDDRATGDRADASASDKTTTDAAASKATTSSPTASDESVADESVADDSAVQTSTDQTAPVAADRYGSGPRLSPALIATLVTIPVMVLVGFIAYAALRSDDQSSTPVESYPVDAAVAPACEKFLAALPKHFDGFGDKEIRGQNAVWPAAGDGDDLTLRCGVTRPTDLAPTSGLQAIYPPGSTGNDGVQWFIVDSVEGAGESYVAVDHRPYVALWVPQNAGNGPITDITGVVSTTLQPAPLEFGPRPSR